jgi:tetratricopeptide (TPR) repeat protein
LKRQDELKQTSYLAFTLLVTLAAAALALQGCPAGPFEASREAGGVEGAITEFRKAAQLKPNNAEAYRYLSLAYRLDGRLEDAIATYQKAAEVNPEAGWPRVGLGKLYLEVGRVQEAIAEFKQAIRLRPYDDEAHDYLSLAYRLDGRLDEAIEVYEEAARVNSSKAWPYLGLGDLYMDEEDAEKATTEYQRAVALESRCVYGYERLGQAYEAQGDVEAALAQYLKAANVALGPDTGMKPYLEKAETHISESDLKAARSVIETARGLMPYDPHILSLAIALDLVLIERYKAQGEVSKARAEAWEVLTMDPKRELALETLTYYGFIDNLDRARIDAPSEPFEHVKATRFMMPFNGDQRQVLFMHPEARVSYQLEMPSEPSVLWFSLAMSPESWDWGGNGATFEIYLDEENGEDLLFSKHISNDAEDRRWHDEEIDLSPYAGQQTTLIFVTRPGPGADFTGDIAGWATPRIMLK